MAMLSHLLSEGLRLNAIVVLSDKNSVLNILLKMPNYHQKTAFSH